MTQIDGGTIPSALLRHQVAGFELRRGLLHSTG